MKKLLATILIALLATSCLFAFVGCNNKDDGKYGDNFAGAISQSTYESVEDAVKGFLEEEINGVTYSGQYFTTKYVNYIKETDLSKEEIEKLAIDKELKDGILGIEKGEVEYKEQVSEDESTIGLSDVISKRDVYIASYKQNGNIKYRFYVPITEEGQPLSNSHYRSICNLDKYMNCTIVDEGYGYDYGYDYVIKVTQNSAEMLLRNSLGDFVGDFKTYLVYDKPNLYECLADKEYIDVVNVTESTLKQALSVGIEDYMGELNILNLLYSLLNASRNGMSGANFVKTKKGFELRGEFKRYKEDKIEVTVSEDRITQYKMLTGFWDVGHYKVWEYKYSLSDFGSTKVDIPKKVLDAIKDYDFEE